jgi:hypothetical protein
MDSLRHLLLPLTIIALLGGCAQMGHGITAHEFDQTWDQLSVGQTQDELLAALGEPRERLPAKPGGDHDEVWVYSRLETVGYTTEVEEGAVGPGGGGLPTYREVPKQEIVQYHLRWQDRTLVSWERIEPRWRS